mmetsp:Transcript_29239/g.85022  ORF Transcript_29239/g.85022 Transcript_29239/m.85022 type:complete len:579 (-) Transcript_29239:385-2121(-)|eukprot:CAMPEP_0181045526 /NCGR_PEP_ID=MMETSP1070-20121207/13856_1 /TAXON_ID=265543 /ORGANISM="Minutocellus polymorphus, Strain NH13" /LENGTH=578 /DNA_ID=CAMNT_0023124063 /DNA_START=101 /DNA_END=1837 /DNA_ORIENTATION=-
MIFRFQLLIATLAYQVVAAVVEDDAFVSTVSTTDAIGKTIRGGSKLHEGGKIRQLLECSSPNYLMDWSELGNMKKHATKLGWNQSTWDEDLDPEELYSLSWDELNRTQLHSLSKLDITSEAIYEEHYESWWWDDIATELPGVIQQLTEIGFTKDSWDLADMAEYFSFAVPPGMKDTVVSEYMNSDAVDIASTSWDDLSYVEQEAAKALGYTCYEWMEEGSLALLEAELEAESRIIPPAGVLVCSEKCLSDDSPAKCIKECNKCIKEEGKQCRKRAFVIAFFAFYQANLECLDKRCGGCFPADATVNVQGKGEIRIDELEISDYVQTSYGYSKVYAFAYGHTNIEEEHQYVQIETNDAKGTTLELSPNHVLFVGGKSASPKMAKDVVGGEIVQLFADGPGSKARLAEITSVEAIQKKGQYAPLTEDGTIIVNKVLASVHSIEGAAAEVKLFGLTLIDMHQFQQMLFAPLRLLCMFSFDDFCSATLHDEEGTHNWDSVTEHLIDMLTYDAPDLETTNFLCLSITLPFKFFVLFGMITAHAAEKVFTMSLSTILFGLATFLYTVISIGYTAKMRKATKKVD